MAKKSEMELEIIGAVFIVERFPDGKEIRQEVDGDSVLELVKEAITNSAHLARIEAMAKEGEEMIRRNKSADGTLREKLKDTRMEHVTRKGDRRKKT